MKLLTSALVAGSMLLSSSVFSQIQITLSALRGASSHSTTEPYMVTDPGREGLFYYDRVDLNSADNGGTVIVAGTKRFKRIYSGPVDVRWFGAKGDYNGTTGTDNTAAINAAIAGAKRGETVMIPAGQYRIHGSIALPLTTVKKIKFEVFGDIYFNKGSGFIIEGAFQDFRSYGLICGMNTGATTEATYAAYTGTGIYLKNAINCHVEVNEIKDFKYGIHMSGDQNGGTSQGSQYNRVYFNSIHHNFVQIRVSTQGTSSGGNWNNSSFWYGGQIGRGIPHVTFGKGGWYGIVFVKDPNSNAVDPMNGHMFHDIGFEGLEKAVQMQHARYNQFIGGRVEPYGVRQGFDFDPVTCVNNKIIGMPVIEDHLFVPGRLGSGTIIEGTALWSGTTTKNYLGSEATESVTPNKLLITTGKYSYTNFMVNKLHDLVSQTGQYPTLQAMMYRINGVIRAVPFKKTFYHVKTNNSTGTIVLPQNIGTVRVEASQAKTFKIDTGDLALYGEEFTVEYLTPKFPITFVRSDNNAVLIKPTEFPSYGIYRCLWADGQFKISKIGGEYKSVTQTGPNWAVADGTETHYVNYQWANATATLPPAAAWPDREITIKNMQAGRNVQVIGVSASDESILQGRGAMTVKSDGTTWNIISFYKRNITY